ncbi:hypothetical protein GF314_14715 [bacterium]|nr:hypothetical protein [bacterium]
MDGRRGGPAGIALLVALVAAAVLWILLLRQTADSPLTRVPLLDESHYLTEAARVGDQGWPGTEPFVMSPGYTLLVAAVTDVAPGEDGILARAPAGLIAVQLVAWLLVGLVPAAVVWRLGRARRFDPRTVLASAVVAGLLPLLYPPAAVYARTVLLDLPLAALVGLALALATWRPRSPGWLAAAALALGLAGLLRAHVLAVLVPLVWWVLAAPGAYPHRHPRLRRAATAAAVVLVALLPVALAAAHNSRAAGQPTGPSLNGGLNLYLGQQPGADGLFTVLSGLDQARDPSGRRYLARRLDRAVPDAATADRIWYAEALRTISEQPGAAFGRWLRKLWLHVQTWDMAQVTALSHWPDEAPALRALPVRWWLLIVLGLTGAVVAIGAGRGRGARSAARTDDEVSGDQPRAVPWRREAWLWLGALLVLVAVQSLFFVVARYRLVLMPSLAVLAGLGVLTVIARVRHAGWRSLARWAPVPLLLGALTVPWGLGEARDLWRGLEANNLARRLVILADAAEAVQAREAARRDAGVDDTAGDAADDAAGDIADDEADRGAAMASDGDADAPETAGAPATAGAAGAIAGLIGDQAPVTAWRARADTLYATACRAMPRQHEPWHDRARNLAALGDVDRALAVLADGTTRVDDPRPLLALRIGLVRRAGLLDEAEALMLAFLREYPGHPGMLHDLAVLQGRRGHWLAVRETAAELRRVAPRDARGWLDGAVAAARLGDREGAVELLEQGLRTVTDPDGRRMLQTNRDRFRP